MAVSYDQAYADLGTTYDPQVQLLQQQQAQAQTDSQAQQSALDQAKVNAFRDITNSANAKGMLFSGFSPDQQATYIGTKYLPAVANLKSTLANTINTSNANIAKLYGQRQQDARQTVAAQIQAEQLASERQQAEADRQAQLQISQARLGIEASRAGAPKALTQPQVSAAIRQGLSGVRGRDGYVSPQDYATAYKDWTQAGYSGSQFDTYFGDLMNPKNGYYQYAKNRT